METSPANRLPEADSLPDGFVEVSADPPSPPSSDYKDALLDLHHFGEQLVAPPAETLTTDFLVDGTEKLDISGDFLTRGDSVSDGPDSVAGDGILESKPGDDVSKELSAPQNEVLIGACLQGRAQGDGRNCETETKGQLELQATNLKESSEAKRKVGKRNTKSEKELLEFTLKYQKVIAERDAAVAVRERLESLCRELQRQNKMLMDECQRVSTEGQNMRLDLSTKFNDAIKDISSKLEVQKDECLSQLKENEMLRNKLKLLADQYSLSEQHFAQKLQQKTLELQLADLKLEQQEEKSAKEETQMQLYAEQVSQLMATEKSLRLQLAADEERFQQFQDALSKSNEVFEAFKQEMEKMAKLIKELKKENEFLKRKCEKSDIALVKLIEERESMKKQLEKVKNQKEKLESLCRSLQAERKHNLAKTISDPVAVQICCFSYSSSSSDEAKSPEEVGCRHCHPALCWPNCDRPIPGLLLYISETRLLLLSAYFSRMGHRYRIAILVASLAVVLVAVRCRETSTTGMYDADYRGPETHSSLPPPELPRTGTVRLSLRRLPITRKLQS